MDLGVSEFVAQPTNNQDLLNRVQLQLRTLEWDKTADHLAKKWKDRRAISRPTSDAARRHRRGFASQGPNPNRS
jgi:hypothetical protein